MKLVHALLLGGCLVLSMLGLPTVAAAVSSEALRIARDSQPRWTIGAVTLREHHGRTRARAELVADGIVIARLRLDPATGAPVADKRAAATLATGDVPRLRAAAARALSRLEVAGWAWPTARGHAWRIPVRCDGHVVATVTVDVTRRRLVGENEREHSEGEES